MPLPPIATKLCLPAWRLRENHARPLFHAGAASKIAIGNFEDDLPRIAEADWIIEVVAENLEIKRGLLAKVAQYRKPGAIVTTIPPASRSPHRGRTARRISAALAGTHFFNPPRYMKLVEFIPGPKTSPTWWRRFAILRPAPRQRRGCCQGHANFIANRIGTYSM